MKILKKIQEINDNKNTKISKLLNPQKKYKIQFEKGNKNRMIVIYSENKKRILSGNYNFYGLYQPTSQLWIWASSVPGVDIKHIKMVNKLKEASYLFENDSHPKMNFYYQLLTQDTILITNSTMLNWINDLILYLSDGIYVFNPINEDSNTQFITLVDIKEKYIE